MYYNLSKEEALKQLNSSENGLSINEAQKRASKYGLNEIKKTEKLISIKLFFKQFADPLILVLIIAAIISYIIKSKTDAVAIVAIIILNTILSFSQEYKAEKAIKLLKELNPQNVIVIRSNQKFKIDAKNLTIGDLIILEAGDKVPADARILEADNLLVDESVLTGESSAVYKNNSAIEKSNLSITEQSNMVFSGTTVREGRATAVVASIGMSTEIGKIAIIVQKPSIQETPLQKKIAELGKVILISILIITSALFLIGIINKFPMEEMFFLSLSLAVSAIPEGLPLILTLILALSLQKLYKKKALIRRLNSIETLGSVTAIVTDKTGTLTENEMTVAGLFVNNKDIIVTGAGYRTKGSFILNNKKIDPKQFKLLLEIGCSCNNSALPNIGDPTELALIVSAAKAKISPLPKVSEIPFNSAKKYMVTTHLINNKKINYLKGAPEKIIGLCSHIRIGNSIKELSKIEKNILLNKNSQMALKALRVIAMAYQEDNKAIFVGLQGMIDPPRKEAKSAISLCKKAGIKIFMVTGDNIQTAVAIARQLNLNNVAIEGHEIDRMNDAELKEKLKTAGIFARTDPIHKTRILKILQENNEIVAMTGDGINDAPALKKADIGIAMNLKGTDIAKDSSDMVLIDDNFNSIVQAIKEGRIIYENTKKFLKYLLSVNFSEIFVVLTAIFTKLPLPFLPLQILWMNLITDSLPALALSKEKGEANIMRKPPRNPKESLLKGTAVYIILGGILAFLSTLILFLIAYFSTQDIAKARTVAITTSVMFEVFFVFSCKSEYSIKKINLLDNKYLIGAVILTIMLQITAIYSPLNAVFHFVSLNIKYWLLIIPISLIGFTVFEIKKLINKRISLVEHEKEA